MGPLDYEQLTLFQEDFPASPFPWLVSKKEKGMTVIYGQKCLELSENLRRVGLSVRMYLESCGLPLPTLYKTWSVKAITPSCLILKLRLSAHSIGGNVSCLWPTPAARDCKGTNSLKHLKTGNHIGQLPNIVKLFPTPTTGVGFCGGTGNFQQLQKLKEDGIITEEERRNMSQGNGGKLNPEWVEWLMGYPTGWTDLNA